MTKSSPRSLPPPSALVGTNGKGIDPREVLDYDAKTGTYRASFEINQEMIDEAILLVVAAVTRRDPLELPLLSPMLDTEAVERLVDSSITGSPSGDLQVSFMFADCEVTIHSYEVIAVRPLNEDATD